MTPLVRAKQFALLLVVGSLYVDAAGFALSPPDRELGGALQDVETVQPANFAEVIPGAFRGATLRDERYYAYLSKDVGVDLVINLRSSHHESKELCERYGLECVDYWTYVVPGGDLIGDDRLHAALHHTLAALRDGKQVYFHCKRGADRTGALAAALVINREACGKSYDADALWARISGELLRHHFAKEVFPLLWERIRHWTYNPNKHSWICGKGD